MDPLAALLAGGGGPADASAGGPPQSIRVNPNQEQKPISILKQMIGLAQQYITVEPDDIDKHTMMKVLSQLQQYLANEQKESEQAMGSSPAIKSLARATRSAQ